MRIFKALWVAALFVSGAASADPAVQRVVEPAAVMPKQQCSNLNGESVSGRVGAAVKVDEAREQRIDGGRYCGVKGTIAGRIKFEVRMPVSGWSQRYVQLGCGGLCGVLELRLEHAEACRPANDHTLALASTDMGHEAHGMGDGSFGKDPDRRIDFAYRGVHLTAVAAQALIEEYYGQKARFRYFSGCSDGGREALVEAQRYASDFDGIAAGAPAMNFQVQNTFYHAWMYRSNHRADGRAILTADKLPALHAAALASCDAADGLKDGLISDPRLCHFDPKDAQCPAGAAANAPCLSAEQVEVARQFYEGPRDAQGHRFTIGGPQVGSELAWADVFVPRTADGFVMSESAAGETLKYLAFDQVDPSLQVAQFPFDEATFERLRALHGLYDATNTDLSPFEARGGKLILWHGWSDPHISPINTIAYYHGVRTLMGGEKADRFVRLFLFPGMYHCGGGDGFGSFDVLTPIMKWVEEGVAPTEILAANARDSMPPGPPPRLPPPGQRPEGAPDHLPPLPPPPMPRSEVHVRTRPIYAYPSVSSYKGSGSVDEARAYTPGPALVAEPAEYVWQGAPFMTAGGQLQCEADHGKLACR